MRRWGGGEKVILLSPHLPIPLSPHPLLMPNAQFLRKYFMRQN
ncbi:MAG: hypothetical protein RMY29_023820 [Nostoc sp. CreGUA01]|nr:hypothetical protein [Nostoc sp. CreGUA01]